MRVLHVGVGNLYGGLESMLGTLARHRRVAPAMTPHFALCFEGRLSRELTALDVPVHLLRPARVSRPLTAWRARRALRELVERHQFDVVICHSAWPHAIFAPAVRAAGRPLVFWLHGAAGGWHWLERWARRTPPDLAICNSRFTLGTLPCLFRGVRGEVVYPPVAPPARWLAPDERLALRRELETPEDAVVLVPASRLEKWKGHRVLLEALTTLREVPGWVAWIAGGGQRPREQRYLERLRAGTARRGLTWTSVTSRFRTTSPMSWWRSTSDASPRSAGSARSRSSIAARAG